MKGHKEFDTATQALQFAFTLLFQFLRPKEKRIRTKGK